MTTDKPISRIKTHASCLLTAPCYLAGDLPSAKTRRNCTLDAFLENMLGFQTSLLNRVEVDSFVAMAVLIKSCGTIGMPAGLNDVLPFFDGHVIVE